MLHTIRNDFLTVTVQDLGAQLQSILGANGTEYLWQGDPGYWADRAPNIFPYVARLTEGCYSLDGKTYFLPIHGFSPTSLFTLTKQTETQLTFTLVSSEETMLQYPRKFCLQIHYRLDGNRLEVEYEVQNRDEKTMYFGWGGHPGFNVPLTAGKAFSDYRLRFHPTAQPRRVGFTADCFLDGTDAPFPLKDGAVLPLDHRLFDNDAIVLKDMAQEVTLECDGDDRKVTLSYPQMPYLGIWHMPKTDAPYVCIEPWSSLPATHGRHTVLEQQEDLITLAPGETKQNSWFITLQ